jgi:hypothetical protein
MSEQRNTMLHYTEQIMHKDPDHSSIFRTACAFCPCHQALVQGVMVDNQMQPFQMSFIQRSVEI